ETLTPVGPWACARKKLLTSFASQHTMSVVRLRCRVSYGVHFVRIEAVHRSLRSQFFYASVKNFISRTELPYGVVDPPQCATSPPRRAIHAETHRLVSRFLSDRCSA